MYLPAHFEESRPAVLQLLLRAHPLGQLVSLDAEGLPVANPIPFLYDADRGPLGTLVGHVARANPVWRDAVSGGAAGQSVLVLFQGPDGYVSPNGYAAKREHGKVVPTWNYATVQARGPLRVLDDVAATRALVTRLTAVHESAQPRPWAVSDAPDDYIASMLRAIVCIEIELSALVGKYKLSQNRSATDQAGVVAGLRAGGVPSQQALADWMAAPDAAA